MKIMGFQDTIEWYNKNANKYAQYIQNIPSIEQINEFIKHVSKGSKVLDAGCASGRDTKLIADKGIDVVGLDLSTELIKIARKNYPDIKFIEGNFLNLPFPNSSFGGIWAQASLLHFETVEDVINALKEFFRVLMPDGIIHILVKEKITDNKFGVSSDKLSYHNRLFQYFTKEEINDYLKIVGFKVIKITKLDDPAGRTDVKWILCLAKKD